MTAHRTLLMIPVLALALMAAPPASAGDLPIDFGFRGGYCVGTDGPFFGTEAVIPFLPHIKLNPNVEWAIGENLNTVTLNADAFLELPVPDGPTRLWAGAGPAILFRDYDWPSGPPGRPPHHKDDDVDLGFNLFSGVGWKAADGPMFYFQGKVVLTSDVEGVFGLGIRF